MKILSIKEHWDKRLFGCSGIPMFYINNQVHGTYKTGTGGRRIWIKGHTYEAILRDERLDIYNEYTNKFHSYIPYEDIKII